MKVRKSSFLISAKNALSKLTILKSVTDCILGYLLSKLRPQSDESFVVASNYGKRADPNALSMVDYLQARGLQVTFIGEPLLGRAVPCVPRGSIKAAYLFICARTCFYTHSLSDAVPYAHRLHFFKKLLRFPQLIFLQHGVIGFKAILSNSVPLAQYIRSLEPTFDKIIVSSDAERNIVNGFGVPSAKLALTGLPRFDTYFNAQAAGKLVLVFFTWQSQMGLAAKLSEVIDSQALAALQSAGYKVICRYHDMQEAGVEYAPCASDDDFQSAIKRCSLLITDDSSLAWDVFYRGQQVFFYKPSPNWLVEKSQFSDRCCKSVDELLLLTQKFVLNAGAEPLSFAAFNDNLNCHRVYKLTNQAAQT